MSRPYRAPEVVFASRSYDPAAIDLWALAATISELFRPFASPDSTSPSSSSEEDDPYQYSERAESRPVAPRRQSLFTSGASDFVLSASIFKILGTPTLESWPASLSYISAYARIILTLPCCTVQEAKDLPNFNRFSFVPFPPTPLESHLPYLDTSSPLLQVLKSMLVCSASERMSAKEALGQLGERPDFRIDLATIAERDEE